MSTPAAHGEASNYFSRLSVVALSSMTHLVRPASHPDAPKAAAKQLRRAALLLTVGAVAVFALMVGFDATEIGLMPPRGAPSLWPVRILTDFGKAANVLWSLVGLLLFVAIVAPALHGPSQGPWRARLLRFGTQVIKWIVGRGRPFVGGKANAFNFSHFAGTEAYSSFPSAHAITGAALAFAVCALWPRAWVAMIVYVLLIIASRLVLLAHHPSDVVAGALIGVVGAMSVRYWFAARRLGFVIGQDGVITPSV
jgi:membrane-associated phospholipid phosphatase